MPDSLAYLDKLHRAEYASFSLANLLGHFGYEKYVSPPMDEGLSRELIPDALTYNLQDSFGAVKLVQKSGMLHEVIALLQLHGSRFDAPTRASMGSINACVTQGVCLSRNLKLHCLQLVPFHPWYGGAVDKPLLDFSSMYPSILMYGLLSADTFKVAPHHVLPSRRHMPVQLDSRVSYRIKKNPSLDRMAAYPSILSKGLLLQVCHWAPFWSV